ncbi:MAG: lytic transglycosylase domain-containing protein [Selenomonadaceae bacterium]|nr:lytic transglycosylase domain-containing protein [Selenomonadaceae bacterium]
MQTAYNYGVDPKLARAIAIAESDMNQAEISPAGAIGVMQLMPETAESLGVDPYDKGDNIVGGVRYIRQMLDTFDGDVPLAVAAYNAGPGAVQRYGGIPPYSETQNYVNRVIDLFQ